MPYRAPKSEAIACVWLVFTDNDFHLFYVIRETTPFESPLPSTLSTAREVDIIPIIVPTAIITVLAVIGIIALTVIIRRFLSHRNNERGKMS